MKILAWENIRLFMVFMVSQQGDCRKTDALLKQLNFGEEQHLVKYLPLGWKQQASLLGSNFSRTKIVFLDEPTGGVDPPCDDSLGNDIHA